VVELSLSDDTEFQAHFFEGPSWDDPDEVEPEPAGSPTEGDQDEDDVEGHASGFG
jgi:hypothetical protein